MKIDDPLLLSLVGLVFIFIFVSLRLLAVVKRRNQKIQELQALLQNLNASFDHLDQQAKLIVKTDLELTKTQEQLDRRLDGLDTLQKASRLISTTLDEKEMFRRLEESLTVDTGFEKNLILIYDKNHELKNTVRRGFPDNNLADILSYFKKDLDLLTALRQGQSFSSINSPETTKIFLQKLLKVQPFILTPILKQDGLAGILCVGNESPSNPLTEGDEELVSILSSQIGQALENSRLFEEIFHSRQELELKVQERTKQLTAALEKVQNVSKMKSEFISAVSHELRTPLTSVKGYASLLMTGKLGKIPQEVKERLEKINYHSDNLVKMINDLLDIARIESGRTEMAFDKCDIQNIIETVSDLLTLQIKEKNIEWISKIDDNIPKFLADRNQIERVFINLAGNAIKFTPVKGKITLTIGLKMKSELSLPVTMSRSSLKDFEKMILVEIIDTGIGIADKDIPHLFDEFYRVDNEINQVVKGTGLGLSLVRKIIEAHHGQIWVTSQVNKGSCFHFILPIQ